MNNMGTMGENDRLYKCEQTNDGIRNMHIFFRIHQQGYEWFLRLLILTNNAMERMADSVQQAIKS